MFWVRTGLDKLKAWVSGEAGEYDWDEAHAKYLSFLTPGPFQRAVAGGDVELVREMLARGEDPNELDAPGGLNAIECAMAMLNHRRRPEDADAVRDLYACIAATLAKKFPAHIPEEVFPRVVAFWAHTGFYGSVAAVAVLAAETNPRTNRGNLLRNLCGAIGA